MGTLTQGLEKMRNVIKSHRNMLDSCEAFILSPETNDDTDDHVCDPESLLTAVNTALGVADAASSMSTTSPKRTCKKRARRKAKAMCLAMIDDLVNVILNEHPRINPELRELMELDGDSGSGCVGQDETMFINEKHLGQDETMFTNEHPHQKWLAFADEREQLYEQEMYGLCGCAYDQYD
jgi:hypothetical protein